MATKAKTDSLRNVVRNMAPHKAARLAMFKWPSSYARHGGGAMDFWDSLTLSEKELCRLIVRQIEEAPEEER